MVYNFVHFIHLALEFHFEALNNMIKWWRHVLDLLSLHFPSASFFSYFSPLLILFSSLLLPLTCKFLQLAIASSDRFWFLMLFPHEIGSLVETCLLSFPTFRHLHAKFKYQIKESGTIWIILICKLTRKIWLFLHF